LHWFFYLLTQLPEYGPKKGKSPMVSVEIGSCRTYFRYSIGFFHSDVIWRQKLSFPSSGISIILSIVGLTSWRHLYRAHR
jgi:hypothetical protein